MQDKALAALEIVLNEPNNLKILNEFKSPFRIYTKNPKQWGKPILKGSFFTFQKIMKRFQMCYFQVMTNIIFKYEDQQKEGAVEYLECHECYLKEEIQTINEITTYCLIFQTDQEITKIWTEQNSLFLMWRKLLRKFCQLENFSTKYKVEEQTFNHIYRIVDQQQKQLGIAKIINQKGLRKDQIELINSEIIIMKRSSKCMLPFLKRIYEDVNYIYLIFKPFAGEDLMKICSKLKLQEPSIASITFHVLKALSRMHSQQFFHGNLKLENIVFIPSKNLNEILILNIKYSSRITFQYREQQIKSGNNMYVAPEALNGGDITEAIDLFALGVCLFFMVFQKYPYQSIKKQRNSPYYEYTMDTKCIDQMIEIKKKNPLAGITSISASGLDLLQKLLEQNPKDRVTSIKALAHHWFINLINKPKENKKLKKFKEIHQMQSLNTILECSEKDDMSMVQFNTFLLQDFEIDEEEDQSDGDDDDDNDSDNNVSMDSDQEENPGLEKQMKSMNFWQPQSLSSFTINSSPGANASQFLDQNYKTSLVEMNIDDREEFQVVRKTQEKLMTNLV